MFYLITSNNVLISNLNITYANTNSIVQCIANVTKFDTIFIQYSLSNFSCFRIISNFTLFNNFIYDNSYAPGVGVLISILWILIFI